MNPDQEVRNAANSLDENLKDILNNSLQTIELLNVNNFNLHDLFSKLFEKIRANHPSIKILIVSWITFLDSIPEIKLLNYLPELLPGLFNMLCDKTKDVNHSAEKSMKHFRKEIETGFDNLSLNNPEVLNKILEILIEQCKSSHEQARLTSFEWVFIFLSKYLNMLTNVFQKNFKIQSSYYTKLRSSIQVKPDFFIDGKGVGSNKFTLNEEQGGVFRSSINNLKERGAVSSNNNFQPEFSFRIKNNNTIGLNSHSTTSGNENLKTENGNIKTENENLNTEITTPTINNVTTPSSTKDKEENLLITRIPFYLFHKILDIILLNVNSQNEQILSLANSCNAALVKMIDYFSIETNTLNLNVKQFEEVLKNYFDSKKESTIDLILNWISKLFRKFHDEMFTKVDVFIDSFTNILSESNENVCLFIINIYN